VTGTPRAADPDSAHLNWGIVGGGMLGMVLARELRAAGHSVTVLEAAAEAGGLAATWEIGGIRWDKHYHVILPADSRLLGLIADIGLTDEVMWEETRTGVYAGGRLHSVSNTKEFLRFPELSMWDKLRLGGTLFYASRIRNWRRLESVPVETWLRRWSGNRTFETFWRPLLRSKLGDNYRSASAAFIWAIMQRLYGARQSGSKVEQLGYVRGGYATILDRLTAVLAEEGIDLQLGVRVSGIAPSPEGGTVVTTVEGEPRHFDRVAVTLAAPMAARVINGLRPDEVELLEQMVYQGIVCVSVLMEDPLADFYVTNITDGGFPFTGVIEMTSLVDVQQFDGRHLVYLPLYTTQQDPTQEMDPGAIEDWFLDELGRMYPEFRHDSVVAVKTSKVRYVLPVSTLNHSQHVPDTWTSVPGVAIVSSAQIVNGTLNVNETLGVVEAALPELLAGANGQQSGTVESGRQVSESREG
jgi:protoporphyrinogen oxidase